MSGTYTGSFPNTGMGKVRPSHIDIGGTADSTVLGVKWSSWDGKNATGTGKWCPGGQQCGPVKIVAFDLGTCDHKYMYQALEWYFTDPQVDPGYGHSFDPRRYLDICTQTFVGGP